MKYILPSKIFFRASWLYPSHFHVRIKLERFALLILFFYLSCSSVTTNCCLVFHIFVFIFIPSRPKKACRPITGGASSIPPPGIVFARPFPSASPRRSRHRRGWPDWDLTLGHSRLDLAPKSSVLDTRFSGRVLGRSISRVKRTTTSLFLNISL